MCLQRLKGITSGTCKALSETRKAEHDWIVSSDEGSLEEENRIHYCCADTISVHKACPLLKGRVPSVQASSRSSALCIFEAIFELHRADPQDPLLVNETEDPNIAESMQHAHADREAPTIDELTNQTNQSTTHQAHTRKY